MTYSRVPQHHQGVFSEVELTLDQRAIRQTQREHALSLLDSIEATRLRGVDRRRYMRLLDLNVIEWDQVNSVIRSTKNGKWRKKIARMNARFVRRRYRIHQASGAEWGKILKEFSGKREMIGHLERIWTLSGKFMPRYAEERYLRPTLATLIPDCYAKLLKTSSKPGQMGVVAYYTGAVIFHVFDSLRICLRNRLESELDWVIQRIPKI